MANGVGDDGRGRVAVAKQRLNAVRGQNFGGGEGKFAAQKTRVVAENDDRFATVNWRLRIGQFSFQIIRNALRGEADVVEGEIARDDFAPAGGAKFDWWP